MDDALNKKEKKVTVGDLATYAGVSPATVSRVLNRRNVVKGDTYDRVMKAINDLGYAFKPAVESILPPSAVASKQGPIFFILPSLSNPFYDEIIKGARTSVREHGYDLLIHESHITENSIDFIESLLKRYNAAGLITVNHIETSICKRLAASTTLVQCSEYNDEVDTSFVSIDNFSSARNAVNHLIHLGRKRIAMLNGPIRYRYSRDRLRGYRTALEDAGLPYDDNYVIHLPDITSDFALSAMIQLLKLPVAPDAVFCSSDVFAMSIIRACHLLHKNVPHDIALVSFDNLDISKNMIPSITSVSQPRLQLGYVAAEALFEKINDPASPSKRTLLDTELIVRESSTLPSAY